MAENTEVTHVSEAEMRVAFSGPAPGANKFYVSLGSPGVRIAFCEQIPDTEEVSFRVAVTLHPSDAIRLRDVLQVVLQDIEKLLVKNQKASAGENTHV